MKTKELIRQLQEADPTGEEECFVGNTDILFVASEPAYWDGYAKKLIRDESKTPYYNVTGIKYLARGDKVVIHTHSAIDAILEFPDTISIDYSELSEDNKIRCKSENDEIIQRWKDWEDRNERGYFIEWAKDKLQKLTEYWEDEMSVIHDFADKYIWHKNPINVNFGESYVSARYKEWDKNIEIYFDKNTEFGDLICKYKD